MSAAPLQLAVVDAARHPGVPVRATLRRWVANALQAGPAPAPRPRPGSMPGSIPGSNPESTAARRRARTLRGARLALVFVDARAGRRLNREFRARDYATNVLTFTYEAAPQVAADIVLCMPVVRREARAQGKTLRQHLAHLVAHGVLHALGYDHENDADASRMQAHERRLLARLRLPDPYEPAAKPATEQRLSRRS